MYGPYEAHVVHDNSRLNDEIEKFIDAWEGTALGVGVKNMYLSGDSYEHICEAMGIDIDEYEEE